MRFNTQENQDYEDINDRKLKEKKNPNQRSVDRKGIKHITDAQYRNWKEMSER